MTNYSYYITSIINGTGPFTVDPADIKLVREYHKHHYNINLTTHETTNSSKSTNIIFSDEILNAFSPKTRSKARTSALPTTVQLCAGIPASSGSQEKKITGMQAEKEKINYPYLQIFYVEIPWYLQKELL